MTQHTVHCRRCGGGVQLIPHPSRDGGPPITKQYNLGMAGLHVCEADQAANDAALAGWDEKEWAGMQQIGQKPAQKGAQRQQTATAVSHSPKPLPASPAGPQRAARKALVVEGIDVP